MDWSNWFIKTLLVGIVIGGAWYVTKAYIIINFGFSNKIRIELMIPNEKKN